MSSTAPLPPPDLSGIVNEYDFEHHYETIAGHHLHYVDEGRGETLLFVHGLPGWSFSFRRLITGLRGNYRCVAPDLIGFGLSDKPSDFNYTLERMIEVLDEFIRKLQLSRITVVAEGYGVNVAMGCAIEHPVMVERLIFINPFTDVAQYASPFYRFLHWPFISRFFVYETPLMIRRMIYFGARTPLSHAARNGYALPHATPESRIGLYKLYQDIPVSINVYNYETILRIEHGLWFFREKPVAIIWGMRDRCYDTRKLAVFWKDLYPESDSLELDDAAHLTLEDAPVESLYFIRNFLAENELDAL